MEARRAHNPEVVGSSPASATIKIPVFDLNAGIFLTLGHDFKMPLMPFWVTYGSLGSKTEILGHTVRVSGRPFLCLFPEQHFGNALGSLCFAFFDDVGIETLCGVHTGVAQLLGDGNNVCTVVASRTEATVCRKAWGLMWGRPRRAEKALSQPPRAGNRTRGNYGVNAVQPAFTGSPPDWQETCQG